MDHEKTMDIYRRQGLADSNEVHLRFTDPRNRICAGRAGSLADNPQLGILHLGMDGLLYRISDYIRMGLCFSV